MRSKTQPMLTVIGVLVTLALSATCSVFGATNDLPAACRAAKSEFRELGKSDVEQARTAAIEALDRLDQRLAQDGTNGAEWAKFLDLAALREQLDRGEDSDKAALTKLWARYNSGHDGLELVWFLDVQRGLQNYVAMRFAVDNPKIHAEFDARIDKLAESLERYAVKPTTEDALVISESLRWLESARQVPALVQTVQQRFVHPNLFGAMSPDILGAGIAESVDDTTDIRDCILGTDIHGTAHTVGQTTVEVAPNPSLGVFDTLFFGTTTSDNVGYHHPVTIYSNATTRLAARKRIWIDERGLSSLPSDANAETDIQICDIQSNKGRGMIERMAWKRAQKQQAMAEAIASSHAEQRLNDRIDQQAAETLDRANEAYVDKFYRPFTERKLFPQSLKFSTTDRALSVVGLQAGGAKLAAPGEPPPVTVEAEISLRVHESMINNLAFDALAGRTVYEEKVQAAVKDALGTLPEKMKGDDDGKPWAITFAPRQPISVTFADNGFTITLRGVRFCRGAEIHNDPMNISASYKIEKMANGVKAVRQGDIQVFPPDFTPGKQQVSGRQQVIRKLLEKRFEKVFGPEMIGEGFEMSGKWKAVGKLVPVQVDVHDGWLVIGWRRESTKPKVAAAASVAR